jgi:hypothetical protein
MTLAIAEVAKWFEVLNDPVRANFGGLRVLLRRVPG